MINPSVQIGIPAYNNHLFLRDAISSSASQDYPLLKVIVADDCSTDDSLNIARSFAHNDKVVAEKNQKNLGRVQNYRELLYNKANSDWYINLDGDDYFVDNSFVSYAICKIASVGIDQVVFFQGNHDIEKLKSIFTKFEELDEQTIVVDGASYFLNFPRIRKFTHCASIYNRVKAMSIDFYNFDCLFSDFNSFSRLSLLGKVILSGRKVAVWRQHDSNESGSLDERKLANELNSLDAVAAFAVKYLSGSQVNDWLKKMREYYTIVFIYHNSTYNPGFKSIGLILRHWKFSWLYPRYIIKNLLLAPVKQLKQTHRKNA